jgi:uncharacterized membrane protein
MMANPRPTSSSNPLALLTPRTWKRAINRRRRVSRIRSSPWLIPGLYAAGDVAAGTGLPRLEQFALPALSSTISVSAAMAFYSSIASGMLALTGMGLSVTIL